MIRTEQEIQEKLQQHKDKLELWRNGFLTPTEPDPEERRVIKRELSAAIETLNWVLGSNCHDSVSYTGLRCDNLSPNHV